MIALFIAESSFGQMYMSKQDAKRGQMRFSKQVVETTTQSNLKSTTAVFFTEGFEGTDLAATGWTTIDNDGDGHGWINEAFATHSGSKAAGSASFDANAQSALTPDNWLISPSIDLSTASGTLFLEWYIAAQDQTWPAEVYRVLVSSSGTSISDFTEVYADETVQAGGPEGNNYWKRTADLSAYVGETIHIAYQHHNCTDKFWLILDDIQV